MKRKGFTLIELLVVIAIIALLMSILMPALARVRELANRVVCGSNESGIVKAMLVYANDDTSGRFPRAGLPGGIWGGTADFTGGANHEAIVAFTGTPPTASVAASLYLLVKYDFTTPKQFVCKSDSITTEYKDPLLELIFDFGGAPGNHCSYAYHFPYSFGTPPISYGLHAASDPGLAVVADRSPYLGPNPPAPDPGANCDAHQGDGQNVAFVDSHVAFEDSADVGIGNDNVYTVADTWDAAVGTAPTAALGPVDREDSVLVNEGFAE